MSETTTAYGRATADWDWAREALRAERERHEREVQEIEQRLEEAERVMMLAETAGPEVAEAYEVAREVIDVVWAKKRFDNATRAGRRTPEVSTCFADAIADLRTGGARLAREYLGVKQYDRWDSQRTDCDYGMAPRHGSIWFRIGLKKPKEALTEKQRLACIRWLRAVESDPDGMLR